MKMLTPMYGTSIYEAVVNLLEAAVRPSTCMLSFDPAFLHAVVIPCYTILQSLSVSMIEVGITCPGLYQSQQQDVTTQLVCRSPHSTFLYHITWHLYHFPIRRLHDQRERAMLDDIPVNSRTGCMLGDIDLPAAHFLSSLLICDSEWLHKTLRIGAQCCYAPNGGQPARALDRLPERLV